MLWRIYAKSLGSGGASIYCKTQVRLHVAISVKWKLKIGQKHKARIDT